MKKLNKGEIEALTGKIRGDMEAANEAVIRQFKEDNKEAHAEKAQRILETIEQLDDETTAYLKSLPYSHKSEDFTFDDVMKFVVDSAVEDLVLPYAAPDQGWRTADKIGQALILGQIEANDLESLTKAVMTQFTAG